MRTPTLSMLAVCALIPHALAVFVDATGNVVDVTNVSRVTVQ